MSTANGHGPTEASPPSLSPYLPPSLFASNRLTIGKNKLWHVYSCIMLIKRHPMVAYTTGPSPKSRVLVVSEPRPKATRQLPLKLSSDAAWLIHLHEPRVEGWSRLF